MLCKEKEKIHGWMFTSESVTEGHPDKVCDIVSDSILDAILKKDPKARVACETFVSNGLLIVGGEYTTDAKVNKREIIKEAIKISAMMIQNTGLIIKLAL
jgi:S-adenosylmethionine synthetase